MRQYDKSLIVEMKEKEYVKSINGVDIVFKPVPDGDREHILDGRVLEIVKKKKSMFSKRAQTGYSLSAERYRPDKISYDLTESVVVCEEKVISVQDHMIDIFIYKPEKCDRKLPVIVYLHGGGFTAGNMKLYANQMKFIAEQAESIVVFPEYRLAPECPFPGGIEDAYGTIRWVFSHKDELNIDINKFVVAGDSAGGSLTNACVLKDSEGIIKKVIELYAAFDLSDYSKQNAYIWSYDEYPIVEDQKELAYGRIDRIKNGNEMLKNFYLQGKATPENPLVSLVYASDDQIRKFPDTVIIASEYDFLRVGNDYMVRRMKELGVNVKSIRYNGCDHGILDFLGIIPQAEDICLVIAEEIKAMKPM